jgi:hypothetical protein
VRNFPRAATKPKVQSVA